MKLKPQSKKKAQRLDKEPIVKAEVDMKLKPQSDKKKKSCAGLNHDFKHLKRYGRADWRCSLCGKNVMLLLVFAYEAGIDLTTYDH